MKWAKLVSEQNQDCHIPAHIEYGMLASLVNSHPRQQPATLDAFQEIHKNPTQTNEPTITERHPVSFHPNLARFRK